MLHKDNLTYLDSISPLLFRRHAFHWMYFTRDLSFHEYNTSDFLTIKLLDEQSFYNCLDPKGEKPKKGSIRHNSGKVKEELDAFFCELLEQYSL